MSKVKNNEVHYNRDELLELSTKAEAGAARYGQELGLSADLVANLGRERDVFLACEERYEQAFKRNRLADGKVADARGEGREYVAVVRNHLKPVYGSRWNPRWTEVGFLDQTLAAPAGKEGLLSLLGRFKLFFTNHPERQDAEPHVNATAEGTAAIINKLSAAIAHEKDTSKQMRKCEGTRQAAHFAIFTRLHKLLDDLGKLLGPDDPRWREFGWNLPSADMPAVPEHVRVKSDGPPGELLITCQPSANATVYRFFVVLRGRDTMPRFIGESTEPSFRLTNVKPREMYEVYVSAANAGAESRRTYGTSAYGPSAWEAVLPAPAPGPILTVFSPA